MRRFGLVDVIAPRTLGEFLERWRAGRLLLIEGDRGKLAGLFYWGDLNRVVGEAARPGPRMRLVKAGSPMPGEVFRPGAGRAASRGGPTLALPGLTAQLRDGATLIVDGVHAAVGAVRRLAEDVEWHLREAVNVNAYAAWGRRQGFGPHWDDHDVLVLQVAGGKAWRVFADNRPHPVKGDGGRYSPPEEPAWTGTLREGDVLFIPRGWWHDAVPLGEPCLHLTVGFRSRTGLDYLDWLKGRLTESAVFRQDLPRLAGAEARREHFARLKRELDSAWGPDADAEYFRWVDGERGLRGEPGLPGRAARTPLPAHDDFAVRINARRPLGLVERPEDGRPGVNLTVAGRTRHFTPAARSLLTALLRGEPLTFAALCAEAGGAMSREEVRLLLAKLFVDGLVSITGPSAGD